MPTVRRARTVEVPPRAVWDLIAEPHDLPRWWPGVQRVEDASPRAWTTVLLSRKGRPVRADYTRVDADPPRRIVWRQEVDETPFERFLAESETEVTLGAAAGDHEATRVEMEVRERLKGVSVLGGFMLRRATRRRVDGALEGLARVLEAPR